MNIHNSGEYSIANQNVDSIALLSYAEDSFFLIPLLKLTQENLWSTRDKNRLKFLTEILSASLIIHQDEEI